MYFLLAFFSFYHQLSFQLLVKTRLNIGVCAEGDTGIDVCFHFIPYLKLRISVILFSHPVVKRREAYDVAAPAGTRAVWCDSREATARLRSERAGKRETRKQQKMKKR